MHMKNMNTTGFTITIITNDDATVEHARENFDKATIVSRKKEAGRITPP